MGKPILDLEDILKQMAAAVKPVLKSEWKRVKPLAELQLRSIALNLELIAELKITKKISEEQARLHLDIQKQAIRTTLLSFEGIGIVSAEKAINAALGAIRAIVNKGIGWKLL